MKNSFSENTKEHVLEAPIKKKCCRHAFEDGCGIFSSDNPAESVKNGFEKLVCPECIRYFTSGLFVAAGNVTDPTKSYHIEFSFPEKKAADETKTVLETAGFPMSEGKRKGRYLLYSKSSDFIEDFLGYIGANNSVFDVINARIIKELRGETNRQVNCDAANISKSLTASGRFIEMINFIIEEGQFDNLGPELAETAKLRLQYPESPLSDLGQKFFTPISKSGVKHRLDKIEAFYNTIKAIKQ